MQPYYTNAEVTIYHARCEDVLPTLASDSVDLIVTDPPYPKDYRSNRGHDHALLDGGWGVPKALVEAARVLRRGRHAYIFGPIDLSDTPLTAQVELIWDKGIVGMGNLELPWSTSHEPITFAVYELSKVNRETGYGRLAARLRRGSVLRCDRANGAATTDHPTEKPVRILRELIESSSCIDELVLDPYMGVGSTLVAAVAEGRRAIGIEQDESYCELAVGRLAQGALDFGGR
jgi:site-specific DNA-methyltransferase (adenine-specific)